MFTLLLFLSPNNNALLNVRQHANSALLFCFASCEITVDALFAKLRIAFELFRIPRANALLNVRQQKIIVFELFLMPFANPFDVVLSILL